MFVHELSATAPERGGELNEFVKGERGPCTEVRAGFGGKLRQYSWLDALSPDQPQMQLPVIFPPPQVRHRRWYFQTDGGGAPKSWLLPAAVANSSITFGDSWVSAVGKSLHWKSLKLLVLHLVASVLRFQVTSST
jgi:hypothetical protein